MFRIIYIIQLSGADIGKVLPLDMLFYRELASSIAAGSGFPDGGISFNPLYPFFLGGIFRMVGDNLAWLRIIQSIIGLVTVYFLSAAGRLVVLSEKNKFVDGSAVGLIAAAIGVMYPQFILYEGSLLATTLVTFITAASFLLVLAMDHHLQGIRELSVFSRKIPSWLAALVLGVLLGAGALGRPNLFFILILAVPAWFFFRAKGKAAGISLAGLCVAGTFIMLLPSTVYNAAQTGRFVPVSTHGGINFYIGNNPGSTGIYLPPEGMRPDMRGLIEDAGKVAERISGRDMTEAEVSDYWFGRSMEWIITNPGAYAKLLLRKFTLFWNGTEVSDIIEISIFRKECGILNVMFIPFAFISVFAFPGFCILFFARRNRAVSMIFLAAALASIMLFYINSRYRIPSVPVLIVMAALSIVRLAIWIRAREWKPAMALVLTGATVMLLMSGRKMVEVDKSAAYTFLGNHYMQTGEDVKGEEAFAEAYRLAPGLVMTRINYGRVLLRRGNLEKAHKMYSSAFEMDPDYPILAIEYGLLLDQMGNRDQAAGIFRYALGLDRNRDKVLACQLLSRMAFAEGKTEEAISWIIKALEIIPGDKKLLGILHRLEGTG